MVSIWKAICGSACGASEVDPESLLPQHQATLKQRREQHYAILAATRQATRRLQDRCRRNGAMQAKVSASSFISVSEDRVGEQNVKEDDDRGSE